VDGQVHRRPLPLILVALIALGVDEHLQVVNALKNVAVTAANLAAALVFVAVADIHWRAVILVAAGSIVGGLLGARIGRRLPPPVLRAFVVALGLFVTIRLLIG
jgi:uncharacterized protein